MFQVVGLQRSGTTWTEGIISNNFGVGIHNSGKHRFPAEHSGLRERRADTRIVVRKRLDHWLKSIARLPATLPKMHPEIFNDAGLDMYRAAELHERFYKEWAEYGPIWEYEDLLRDPVGFLSGLALANHLKRIPSEWKLGGPTLDRMNASKNAYYLGTGFWGAR